MSSSPGGGMGPPQGNPPRGMPPSSQGMTPPQGMAPSANGPLQGMPPPQGMAPPMKSSPVYGHESPVPGREQEYADALSASPPPPVPAADAEPLPPPTVPFGIESPLPGREDEFEQAKVYVEAYESSLSDSYAYPEGDDPVQAERRERGSDIQTVYR